MIDRLDKQGLGSLGTELGGTFVDFSRLQHALFFCLFSFSSNFRSSVCASFSANLDTGLSSFMMTHTDYIVSPKHKFHSHDLTSAIICAHIMWKSQAHFPCWQSEWALSLGRCCLLS
jgi:hypothetical protein